MFVIGNDVGTATATLLALAFVLGFRRGCYLFDLVVLVYRRRRLRFRFRRSLLRHWLLLDFVIVIHDFRIDLLWKSTMSVASRIGWKPSHTVLDDFGFEGPACRACSSCA